MFRLSRSKIAGLKKQADKGDREAQYSLGWHYYEGLIVPKDLDRAISLLNKAAEQGHPLAKDKLKTAESDLSELDVAAELCIQADELWKGSKGNTTKALRLYKQAADLGDVNAKEFLNQPQEITITKLTDKKMEAINHFLNLSSVSYKFKQEELDWVERIMVKTLIFKAPSRILLQIIDTLYAVSNPSLKNLNLHSESEQRTEDAPVSVELQLKMSR